MIDLEERMHWAEVIAKHLCDVWGWQEDEPEAAILASNIAFNIDILVANTRTRPEALLQALVSSSRAKEIPKPTRDDFVLRG